MENPMDPKLVTPIRLDVNIAKTAGLLLFRNNR